MNVEQLRAIFPHLANGIIHLNHAGVSPLSTPVAEAMKHYIDLMSIDARIGGEYGWARWNSSRNRIAKLIGASPNHVAITKNTAHGISILADGLKWQDGDEVVFADCEYPANTFPWLAQQDRGVICRIVPSGPDSSLSVDDYRKAMSAKTRVLAVSWVQFSTGLRSDLAQLRQLASDYNALFVVDVIQGLGALKLDASQLGIDAIATGSQKWLMGPVGVGALYIKPEVLDQFRLVNMGALSVTNAMAFEPLGFSPQSSARRYEEGTPNIPGAVGLDAALELLESFGADAIEARLLEITRYTMDGLRSRGYEVTSPDEDSHRGGIIIFKHPTLPNKPIMEALSAAKVNNAERGGRIRFAPHFYATPEDMDRALNALP